MARSSASSRGSLCEPGSQKSGGDREDDVGLGTRRPGRSYRNRYEATTIPRDWIRFAPSGAGWRLCVHEERCLRGLVSGFTYPGVHSWKLSAVAIRYRPDPRSRRPSGSKYRRPASAVEGSSTSRSAPGAPARRGRAPTPHNPHNARPSKHHSQVSVTGEPRTDQEGRSASTQLR